MTRPLALLLLPLCLIAAPVPSPAGEGDSSFFTEEELRRLDDALALTNMTRKDLAFDKLTGLEDYRRFRLPTVDRSLEDPLATAEIAWEWAGRAAGRPGEILGAVRETLALTDPEDRPELSPTERERLVRWAYAALVEEDSHDGLIPRPEEEEDPEEMLGLAERAQAGVALRIRVAEKWLSALAGYVRKAAAGEPIDEEGVVVSGPGDDVHDFGKTPPRLLIDLGGNDRYVAPARATPDHPLAIVVDLGGNDVYGDGESLSCGAGFFGVGILWDRGDGDDRYFGGHLSCGAGLFGVGILIDEGGSDIYRCRDTGQGAGAWGAGLLLDRGEGNDTFHADLFGQGFAYVGGFGLLHNEKGNDVYEAGGVHLHYPLFNDRFQSLSQGFSIGMRPFASGGVAMLVDDEGNDRYCCDIYGQGAAYWFAFGGLVDRKGNDTYNLGQYGQGGGIHLASGCLLDLEGEDLYYNMHGVGTGGAHDFAVGILVDRKGDDYYAGSGGTMGGALTNSFALLLDAAGNDGYSAVKVDHAVGGGRSARGMGSIGIFLDLAGKDLIGTRKANETVWVKETYGAGIDLEGPPPGGGAPSGRPRLSPEEAEKRVREAAWIEAEGRFDLEKLWDRARQWAVGEMADVVPVAIGKLCELGRPAVEKALSRAATRDGLEFRAVQQVLKRFGAEAVPALEAMLAEEDPRRRGRAATLLADLGAKDATGKIVPLLDGDKTRLAALDALARLGVPEVWEAVARQLSAGKERERVSALRCLEKLRAVDALPWIVERLSGDEIFTVRFAAEDVLVTFAEEALPLLAYRLEMEPELTAKRHVIRALGRISDEKSERIFARLLSHADWRIRIDAAGALAPYLGRGGLFGLGEGRLARHSRLALRSRLDREENRYVAGRIKALLDD